LKFKCFWGQIVYLYYCSGKLTLAFNTDYDQYDGFKYSRLYFFI